MPVSGFGVQCLATLCLSADVMFRIWKRCACQGIWCSMSRNAVPVSGFNVQKVETFCRQQIWHSESGNVVPVSECGVQIWKRCVS